MLVGAKVLMITQKDIGQKISIQEQKTVIVKDKVKSLGLQLIHSL